MNNNTFQTAVDYYNAKDYGTALSRFTECLQDAEQKPEQGEIGLLYHRIGNCLMKLRDHEEAIHAYTQATADSAYDAIGAVNTNLGNAYAALHDYDNAVKHYEIAVSDRGYATPYKAYSGMGKAYLKLGKSADAGSAFRSAALDEANPNPVPALLNLGICFMALGRPGDAVASYESALQFDMDVDTKNKLYANLGQAYVADGKMQQGVNAFEMALADKTYFLNDAASVDYQRAVGAVAQGTDVMDPLDGTASADVSGLDISGDGVPVYHETDEDAANAHPLNMADSYGVEDNYETGDERFFNASDEELERWSRGVARQDRKRRNVGLKVLVTLIVLALLALSAGLLAYTQGWGYPSQQTVVQNLFTDKNLSASHDFMPGISSDDIATMLDPVITDENVVIDGVESEMNSSVVYATATTSEGGTVNYKISLARDGLGWKLTNVELYFPSQESGSTVSATSASTEATSASSSASSSAAAQADTQPAEELDQGDAAQAEEGAEQAAEEGAEQPVEEGAEG